VKRALLLVALVGCTSSHQTSSIDAPPVDDAVCKADLEAMLDRSCSVPTDCVLVESADCCGPIMLAVHAGTESMFPAREHDYETCLACPPLGCAHQKQDEAGHVAGSNQAIVPDCVAGRCTSVVR
jgi:hypothetical protein